MTKHAKPFALTVVRDYYDRAGSMAAQAAAQLGYPCEPGCAACCYGLFLVTTEDMRLIAHGLALLPVERRAQLQARAAAYVLALEEAGLDVSARGHFRLLLDRDPGKALALLLPVWPAIAARMPCPLLDVERRPATTSGPGVAGEASEGAPAIAAVPADPAATGPAEGRSAAVGAPSGAPAPAMLRGTCGLYEYRPLHCRMHFAMGPAACQPGSRERVATLDASKAHAKAHDALHARPAGLLALEIAGLDAPKVTSA